MDKSVRDVAEALRRSLLENDRLRKQNERIAGAAAEPIAIVSMSCRYPGGAGSPDDLWRLVADGTDAIGDFPANRGWDLSRLFDDDPEARGHSYSRAGGFLDEPGVFDARLFGISPREALAMDPQQRLLLHASWEVFERAGIAPLSLEGRNVGVFVGGGSGEHPSVLAASGDTLEGEVLTSSASSVLSGRISYTFGLSGPAVTVDTACSSSLVAVHLAVQALRSGECELALGGGVAVMHSPAPFIEVSRQRGLAGDGRCKAFAAGADGTGFAEGVGVLLLERLSDARRNGHTVLAVVRGSAVNQDGASNGLSAPNGAAQRRVIRQALGNARLTAADVDAVEAHGTGTVLGDPIEAQAIIDVYGKGRRAGSPLLLGSIKSNIGHAQAAAGVAGVIKMVMSMRHGVLPQTLHAQVPTPHVDWSAGDVELLSQARAWPDSDRPRRAGVSSFGVSGTNAHLILEQAPASAVSERADCPPVVLPYLLSGKDSEAVRRQAEQLHRHLDSHPEQELRDVALSLAAARSPLDERAVVLAQDRTELRIALDALASEQQADNTLRDTARRSRDGVLFVFPGHGWQWNGMVAELLTTEPVFAARLTECAAVIDPMVGWSLLDLLRGDAPLPDGTEVMQPVLFSVMVSLAELWRSYGVEPGAVVGHSQGEIAAACVAGVLSLADAARIVVRRSRLFADELVGNGTLALIGLPVAEVHQLLRSHPALTVAAVNNPATTVVAGDEDRLLTLVAACTADGVRARMLPGTVASHCDRVEPLRDRLLDDLAGIEPVPGTIPFYSAVTAETRDAAELGPEYWYLNAREPVEFDRTIRTAIDHGFRTFVELSAHPWLTAGIEQTAEAVGAEAVVTGTLRRDDGGGRRFHRSLAAMQATGVPVDWKPLFERVGARLTELPTYSFDETRYWMEISARPGDLGAIGLLAVDHPLLAAAVSLANSEATVITGLLSERTHPWLADHAVGDTVVLPGSAFAELALRAGALDGFDHIEEMTLESTLVLPAEGAVRLQVVIAPVDEHGRRTLSIHSQIVGDDDVSWRNHANAILTQADSVVDDDSEPWLPANAQPVAEAELDGLYSTLSALGMIYGPAFQGLASAWRSGDEVFAEVNPVASLRDVDRFGVHPALLDAALHAVAFGSFTTSGGRPLLPFAWRGVTLHRSGSSTLRVRLGKAATGTGVSVRITDDEGRPVLTAESIVLREMPASARQTDDLLHVRWQPVTMGEDPVGDRAALGADQRTVAAAELGALADTSTVPEFVLVPVQPARQDADGAHATVEQGLDLVQTWLATPEFDDSQLVFVTRNAMTTADESSARDLAGAALWGLIRSAQSEHPGRFVLVDIDDDARSAELLSLAVRSGEPQLAVRDGVAVAPQLTREQGADRPDTVPLDPDGTVLITGGTGTIGAELARHFVTAHGVRNLALVGRRGIEAPGAAALRDELAALGVEVAVIACDVADRVALSDLLDRLPRLTAVVHAAVVLDDGVVTAQTPERIASVLRPKIDAAWHLHELTRERDLVAFLLFSSAAGTLGTPGQSGYAAANAYLDALAELRRTQGLPALALAWGRWARADGLTADLTAADVERLDRSGIVGMTPAEGLALLDAARAVDRAAVVPMRVDPVALRAQLEEGTAHFLLRGLVRSVARVRRGARAGSRSLLRKLAGLSRPEQQQYLLDLVVGEVGAVLGYDGARQVGPTAAFADLGFTSLTAVEFRNRMATASGLRLPATLAFDYPNSADLAGFLLDTVMGGPATAQTPQNAVTAFDEPIAIVAMSCRYPGGIDSPEALWRLVAEGGDVIAPFPLDRGWDMSDLGAARSRGVELTREGGFLDGAADFDPGLFGISPREAIAMDPQQRVVLELAWEAFERAGIAPLSLRGSSTGVYAGVMYHDYGAQVRELPEGVEGFLATGVSGSVVSGRISYTFGLEGPAVTVDTACSSSLVAMNSAVQALRTGECDMALAGGVTVMATPGTFIEFSRQRGLAADGRSKSFAASADGTSVSEGAGLVLLERLADARRNGHPVLALVRGTAVNQDGASNGLTAPNGPSQQRVIRQALRNAGLSVADVDVVEAHGTGTTLGDPIEAQAVIATYGQDRPEDRPVWLGSLKSNIGHAQAASGVAGVIKMVEAMRHGVVPKTLHLDAPTPHVDWAAGAVRLATEAVPWPESGRRRRSGVSSFGVSGTNAHVVLEQAPEPETETAVAQPESLSGLPFVLSARTTGALREQAARLVEFLDEPTSLRDLAWSLATTRAALDERAVVIGRDRAELAAALNSVAGGDSAAEVVTGRVRSGKTAFVFPGQGAQWAGMGRELIRTSPVFAARITECAALMDPLTGWSLLDALAGGQDSSLDRVDVVQPVSFAVMVSLAAVWESFGVVPDVVVGHSQGEIAAACVVGALSLADGIRVVVSRSRIIAEELSGRGGMVSIGLPVARVEQLIAPFGAELSVAALNGPAGTVISGGNAALDEVIAECRAAGVRVRRVEVDYASHSAQVDVIAERLNDELSGVVAKRGRMPVLSTVRGRLIDGSELDVRYWIDNLRQPVRFFPAISKLLAENYRFFIEVSSHPVLVPAIQEAIEAADQPALAVGSIRRDDGDLDRMIRSLAEVQVCGRQVDWSPLLTGAVRVALPTYPFERQRYWLESSPARQNPGAGDLDAEFWDAVESEDVATLAAGLEIDAEVATEVLPGLVTWRRRKRDASVLDSWRYRVDWHPVEVSGTAPGRWLVVVPAGTASNSDVVAVAGTLADAHVLEVETTDRHALAEALAAFDTVEGIASVGNSTTATLALIQALGDAGVAAPLWLVTCGAVATVAPDPVQAELWGLGPVAGLEHAQRWGGLVDLPATLDDPALARLRAVLTGTHGQDQVAIRANGVLARRIVPAPTGKTVSETPAWRTSGTTLISGGTGTLGALTARWAVQHGAERVVLVSRRGTAADGTSELAAELRALGAQVAIVGGDITDRAAVAAAVALADDDDLPLRMVVHTAASLEVASLPGTTVEEFDAMMCAKVDGAVHLDELTEDIELDAFVLYSSVAGVWGSGAHGAYGAANAHLNALAERRRARGRTAISIAWGVWGTPNMWDSRNIVEGMVVGERQTRHGLPPMDPDLALAGMHTALDDDETFLLLADVKWENFVPLFTMNRPSPLLGALPQVRSILAEHGSAGSAVAVESQLRERLSKVSGAEREALALEQVRTEVAVVLGHASAKDVAPDRAFQELGFTSLTAVELRNRLVEATGLKLPSTMVFDYPTAKDLARYLIAEAFGIEATDAPAAIEPAAIDDNPIVIVGMACRYPGGVGSPEDLWRIAADGIDAISGFPTDRGWDVENLYHPDPAHVGTSYVRHGGFLEAVADFDAGFFGISPREATVMDPQQRLLLETAWEAFEHTGIDPLTMRGSRTGVFVGANPAPQAGGGQVGALDGLAMTGSLSSVLSGRVSYVFGLEGPAVTVDTACSSSLVAMHLSAQALRTGECSLALAGGVMVMSSPAGFIGFSQQRALAKDGRCKAFSAAADGMAFAEGVGWVVLERLSDATRNGHRVLAVLRGSAVNQDGASNGMTAPNGPAQQRVIRDALHRASLSPDDIDVVEAHGTGTALGDPIEAQALLATYGRGRSADRPVLLGSIKSNIGHSQAAAGVAGVIKAVESLRRAVVPATLHAEEPTPEVDWSAGAVELVTRTRPWPETGRTRRAAVSSFGISGTNAHVILEQAPEQPVAAVVADPDLTSLLPFVVSGRSAAALRAQSSRLRSYLDDAPEASRADLSWSLLTTRAALDHQAVVVARNRAELIEGLSTVARGDSSAHAVVGRRRPGKLAFVFSGQGAQRAGMGRELYAAFPVFADAFDEVCTVADPLLGKSLRDIVFEPEQAGELDRTEFAQPGLFAVEYALFRLLRSFGVVPDLMIGHSVGEITAACVAGALPVADAARLVVARGRLMQALPEGGAMVAIQASEAEVTRELSDSVSLAAVNSPGAVVVSGVRAAVEAVAHRFAADGRKTTWLAVSHAFHSHLMEPMLDEFERVCATVEFTEPAVPVVSNRTGELMTAEQWGSAKYWVEHAREAVRFADGIATLAAHGVNSFLEVGPDATLTGAVAADLEFDPDQPTVIVSVLRAARDEPQTVFAALAELFVHGHTVDWSAGVEPSACHRVELPTYAFQHRRYWPELVATETARGDSADAGFWETVENGDLGSLATSMNVDAAVLGEVLPGLMEWRRRRLDDSAVADWRYRETWAPVTVGETGPQGSWLVLLPEHIDQQLSETIIGALGRTADVDSMVVPAGISRAALAELLGQARALDGVLSLLAFDERADEEHRVLVNGFVSTVVLVQALHDGASDAQVWCVTRDAMSVVAGDLVLGVAQSPIWGLGRVAALEYPQRWGGLVDLPSNPDPAAVANLVGLLGDSSREDQIALRGPRAYGRRLTRAPDPVTTTGTPWKPAGTVLVTGATGALGSRVARWAAANGAQHLLLISRRGANSPGAAELAADLRDSGATVTLAACDAADRDTLATLLAAIPPEHALTAVVHAAGVPVEGMLADTTIPEFADAVSAKVDGALALHDLTSGLELAAFVLFSSGSASWGSASNAAYASGNAFLDGLGRHRKAAGLVATTVAWGNWGGGGMTANDSAQEALLRRGVRPMNPELAFGALLHAVEHGETQLTVADIDWQRFAGPFTFTRPSPLISGIPEAARALQDQDGDLESGAGSELRQRLAGLPRTERRQLLSTVVSDQIGTVLGYSGAHSDDLDRPFTDLGFDSVTAVELRNRLSSATGTTLPATLVFDYPTLTAVADFLVAELDGGSGELSILDEFDRLGREVAVNCDAETRAKLSMRLQTLLAKLGEAEAEETEDVAGLDAATDDEIFDLIDNDLGVS
ncbi:type I polyketide synthase [Nocardia sp. NPDC056952]|uniref:type I polyketide synthase n=1 Tax=Nocardia sp. NPDC056952 TaxID=3345979 RepID=UPI003633EE33